MHKTIIIIFQNVIHYFIKNILVLLQIERIVVLKYIKYKNSIIMKTLLKLNKTKINRKKITFI